MSRLFSAYVMVLWSAAAAPKTGKDSIWIGVFKRDVRFRLAFEAHNPATRADAVKMLDAIFAELRRKGERTLVGFDFPFGLPRELVEHLGWPTGWRECMRHYASLTRPQIRATFSGG